MTSVRLAVLVVGDAGPSSRPSSGRGCPWSSSWPTGPAGPSRSPAEAGIATELVDRREFGGFGDGFDRAAYTQRVVDALQRHESTWWPWPASAPCWRRAVHDAYPGRVLNTHPALLPAFQGWHAVEDALAAGVEVTGCTVHSPPPTGRRARSWPRRRCAVLPGTPAATLHERIKAVERRLYPETIRQVMSGDPGGTAGR